MKLRGIVFILALMLTFPLLDVWAEDVIVSGIIKNKADKKKIPNVSLTVPGTNIGTVSNTDGSFTLKIPDSLSTNGIKAEQIGYRSYMLQGDKLKSRSNGSITIWLEPIGKILDEVTVYAADPRTLIENAIRKIPQNYPSDRNMFSAFYRETIRKGNRYIGVSEAIVSVMKNPYKIRNVAGDRVQMVKGRRLVSQRSSDTLSIKIIGGPVLPVVFDIVKNEDILFGLNDLDNYDFRMEPMTSIDDRLQFVVGFTPNIKLDYPLYKGKVYIDCETSSFTKAEFSLDVSDKDKVIRSILHKKPKGLRFKPQEVEFTVTYKYQDGLSYLNNISARTRFKCDWKRRLFSAGYTVNAELVMVDRDDNPSASISKKEAVRDKDIFYDMVDNFNDPDFWKDYNIIEPTESLEKAVIKLK